MTNLFRLCQWWAGRWCLAATLGLALAACDDATDIGTELPPTDNVTGTVYIDTITVRTSTVLVDSVPTSTSSYLMLGRYTDPRLGAVTASSYARLGLGGGVFEPAATVVYDSLVLLLKPDTYRYGDTTRTQQLRVHRLREALKPSTTYYAFNSLDYDATPLGTRSFRARPTTSTMRVRLADALGRELLTAGQNRQLTTDDELAARLPGLVLTSDAADNAAILRFSTTDAATVSVLPRNQRSNHSLVLHVFGGKRQPALLPATGNAHGYGT